MAVNLNHNARLVKRGAANPGEPARRTRSPGLCYGGRNRPLRVPGMMEPP